MNLISNIKEYSVAELNSSIKELVEDSFHTIKVKGEVVQLKIHSSGHFYFSLKEGKSLISAICWRSNVPKLNIKIEDGISVIIKGRVTTYDLQSKYQLIVDQIDYEGEGTLLKILEERKKKLLSLGFFDDDKKKKIPKLPSQIGVITSDTGSVIKDIIHRISDRYPLELKIFPANVQGERSIKDLVSGLEYFNKLSAKPDLIIIARGGGSLEDLMPFNEEELVTKIYESKIPVVSAVGHETDFTLCDLAADLRAPTPSAAAEMAVPEKNQLLYKLKNDESFLQSTLKKTIVDNKLNLELSSSKLPNLFNIINTRFQSLDFLEIKITDSINTILKNSKINFFRISEKFSKEDFFQKLILFSEKSKNIFKNINVQINNLLKLKKNSLTALERQLLILSYKKTLKRGFSVVRYEGKIITDEKYIKENDSFEIEFYENNLRAKKL